jgi:hypothetical protein
LYDLYEIENEEEMVESKLFGGHNAAQFDNQFNKVLIKGDSVVFNKYYYKQMNSTEPPSSSCIP